MDTKCHGVIVAAGRSVRFGADKLSCRLEDGETVLFHAARSLIAGGVSSLVIVGEPHDDHGLSRLGDRLHAIIPGGRERVDSVRCGLAALPATGDFVAVHDGARPFCNPELVRRLIEGAVEVGASVPMLPSVDSLLQIDAHGEPQSAFERASIRRVQTPQVARRQWLLQALESHGHNVTDESSALLAAGFPVKGILGEERNIKITQPTDLPILPRRTVVGQGFDVHRYDPNRPLFLGGCELEDEIGLSGHSDADVLLHALTDALLGTVGAGDIGEHFPPSDERWKDADSVEFLKHALNRVAQAGGRVEHVDLCLIGERPRMSPYKARIQKRLSDLLGLPIASINVKATTTEGLGFTGRKEGLAAQAVATVTLPPCGRESVD